MIMMASDCPGLRSRSQACRLLYPARRIPLTWSPSPRIRRRSSVGLPGDRVAAGRLRPGVVQLRADAGRLGAGHRSGCRAVRRAQALPVTRNSRSSRVFLPDGHLVKVAFDGRQRALRAASVALTWVDSVVTRSQATLVPDMAGFGD